MAVIDLTSPYAMKQSKITFGVDDYTDAVSQAEFQPTYDTAKWEGIRGNTINMVGPSSWSLVIGLAQDDADAGLLTYLFENEGTEVTVLLEPVEGGTGWSCPVTISPANVGGSAGAAIAVSTVTLACSEKPTRIPAV
jgi:hypothetical protein